MVAWEPASERASVFAQDASDLYHPLAIAVDDAGRAYVAIADPSGARVVRVTPAGIGTARRIQTVAGGVTCPFPPACPETRDVGDGGRATDACLTDPRALAIGRDGSIYIAEWQGLRVRRVAPDGAIETFAGRGQSASDCSFPLGDGGPATSARLYGPTDVEVAPNGRLLIGDISRIREVRPALPDAVVGESIVAEPDGSLVHRFDQWGRHVRTEHGITGETLVTFSYEGTSGRLTEVQSPLGATSRSPGRCRPTSRRGSTTPSGQQTVLSFDAAGYLQAITDPESHAHTMTYFGTAPGLLDTFATADGATWSYGFDRGRLIRDTAPSSTGVEQTLTRSVCGDAGYTCDGDVTSGWGVAHNFTGSTWADRTYDVWRIGDSVLRRRQTLPSGARAVSEIGDLDGTLPGPAGAAVPVTQRALTTDGTLVEAATGADPRPGLGDMVQAVRATWPCPGGMCAPSPHQASVRVARTISPTDAATLYDVDQMTDAITVNGTRTTTISMLRTTTSGCEQQWTIQTPLGTTSQVCADALGRPRSVTAPGFHDLTIDYDSATGGVQTVTQLGRQTRVLYQDATMAPQPWPSEVRRATGPSSYLDRVRLTRDGAGWITQAIYNGDGAGTRTLGIDNDLRGRPRFLTLPNAQVHEHQYTALDVLSAYLPPDVHDHRSRRRPRNACEHGPSGPAAGAEGHERHDPRGHARLHLRWSSRASLPRSTCPRAARPDRSSSSETPPPRRTWTGSTAA
ncbi:MAG: hypothetical protein M5U28_52115 [Sandaracinaceae bacterium]|nr:hypothetical protein [Sandaracinaceae bacterium]